jgi:hypothetical protein
MGISNQFRATIFVGTFFLSKYRRRLKEAGHYTVAKQLRKMGVPIEIALYILCNKGN